MSLKIVESEAAQADVIGIAYYIGIHGGFESSDRVIAAIKAAYERLSENPQIGAIREFSSPELTGIRMIPVSSFRNYLIFYQTTDTEVVIRRVVHGARHIEKVLINDEL